MTLGQLALSRDNRGFTSGERALSRRDGVHIGCSEAGGIRSRRRRLGCLR